MSAERLGLTTFTLLFSSIIILLPIFGFMHDGPVFGSIPVGLDLGKQTILYQRLVRQTLKVVR